MSVECVKNPKLLCEERRVRHNASKRAWAAKHYEKRRAYQLLYARRQREALLNAGFVPNPVGRPNKDPEAVRRTCAHRERGSDYKEYQKLYHRQFRARRRALGWVLTPCGLLSPEQVEALKNHRSFIQPEKSASPKVNTTTNQNGESNS